MYASTVIAVRTDREIVIGADSKMIATDRSNLGSVCKIIQIGNIFFAHTGLAGNQSIGFSVQDTARQAVELGGDLAEKVDIFGQLVHRPLHQTLVATRRDAPQFYQETIEGQSALSAVFGVVVDGTPTLSYVEFHPVHHPQSDDSLAVRVDPGIDLRSLNEQPAFVVIGHKDAVIAQLERQRDIWIRMGILSATRKLIQLQIESTPHVVGPPIAILRIDRHGAKWINKPSVCPGVKRI